MKRLLTLTAVLGIVGVTSWAAASRPAYASPLCDSLHGTSCPVTGAKTPCTTSDGFPSTCTCTSTHHWRCLL